MEIHGDTFHTKTWNFCSNRTEKVTDPGTFKYIVGNIWWEVVAQQEPQLQAAFRCCLVTFLALGLVEPRGPVCTSQMICLIVTGH